MWPNFVRTLNLDALTPRTNGKPVHGGVEFNEKHPLTLERRADVWKKVREIQDEQMIDTRHPADAAWSAAFPSFTQAAR